MTKKAPSTNLQAPEKLQAPISKIRRAAALELDSWCFFGAWGLGFGTLRI
jgi:hypothetical protein